MSDCLQESKIAAELARGALSEGLRVHLSDCAVCREVHSVAGKMLKLASELSAEPGPSAASMWWRLNLRMRREQAHRAQRPLVWMSRVFYVAITLAALFLAKSIPGFSGQTAVIGVAALSAVVLPAAVALWSWSRSKI